jgi:hypothetical protein
MVALLIGAGALLIAVVGCALLDPNAGWPSRLIEDIALRLPKRKRWCGRSASSTQPQFGSLWDA